MSLICSGLDHLSAPEGLLRDCVLDGDRVQEALALLEKSDNITEAVVLSTCLRTEIYVDAVRYHGAVADIRALFSRISQRPVNEIADALMERHDENVCRHLFQVAAGVESAVVGEGEVLGQVNKAWHQAVDQGACKTVLSSLFRHALVTGKRARHETSVSKGVVSVGKAAIERAAEVRALDGGSVLVVGAGDVATSVAHAARRAGAADIVVANRSTESARRLADSVDGRATDLHSIDAELGRADVVVGAAGAPQPLIHAQSLHAGQVVVDLAVPGDVEEGAEQSGATLISLREVEAATSGHREERRAETPSVMLIVEEEVRAYFANTSARLVAPLVTSIRDQADEIRRHEMQRFGRKLPDLTPEEWAKVDDLTHSIVAKLLHNPTVNLKQSAGTPEGERRADALRYLFGV